MYPGFYNIDDLLTFYANTHNPASAGEIDADAVPTYRVYKEENPTPILTGSMALLDDENTTGFYSEQITLSAANGFEENKNYAVRITATINGETAATIKEFRVVPPPSSIITSLTLPELPAGEPPISPTVAEAVMLWYMWLRNDTQATRGATEERRIKNDAGTVITKATTNDDGNIFGQGKLGTP